MSTRNPLGVHDGSGSPRPDSGQQGAEPLHDQLLEAIAAGNENIVQLLLQFGVKPQVAHLSKAIAEHNEDIVELLLHSRDEPQHTTIKPPKDSKSRLALGGLGSFIVIISIFIAVVSFELGRRS